MTLQAGGHERPHLLQADRFGIVMRRINPQHPGFFFQAYLV